MKKYDFSGGSKNTHTIEARHGIIKPCLECGETTASIVLDGDSYFRYFIHGAKIQDAFPNLSAKERDFLMMWIHPECSDAFYGVDPEDDKPYRI